MNSNIDFQSVCLGTILYSSTEIIDFSWQLYFFLVNFKSEIWQIYVIRRHHCQSTRRSYLPLLIFSYKGISILYYSMDVALIGGSKSKIFNSLFEKWSSASPNPTTLGLIFYYVPLNTKLVLTCGGVGACAP